MAAPLLVPALLGGLASVMGSLVGRVLIALGIGFVTYTGISTGMDAVKVSVVSSVQGLPSDAVGLIGFLWIDKGLTVIFSSVAVSLAMRGIGGSVKRAIWK